MTASAGPALQRLHEEFGDRVAFVTLYVREAHPGDRYPQADSFEEKLQHARDYRDRDGISWPIAVDTVEGDLHQALGGYPNAAYVMDADGKVAFRSIWSNDERVLREGLAGIVSDRPLPIGERTPRAVPMIKGMGRMYDMLSISGPTAQRDVRKEAPPMYAMARLAALFQPLPPLGRGLAAMGVSFAGMALLMGGLRAVARRR